MISYIRKLLLFSLCFFSLGLQVEDDAADDEEEESIHFGPGPDQ